jgi:hypothetical protein
MPDRRVHSLSKKPLKEIRYAAIAICDGGVKDILHAGVLFTDVRGAEQIMMLHLRTHHALELIDPLRDEALQRYVRFHWVELAIPPERLRLISRLCRTIERRYPDGKLAYAVRYKGGTFSTETGEFLSGEGLGLTCATFVLAVFASQGWRLLDPATWRERKEDRAAHAKLVEIIRGPGGDPKHADIVKSEAGCARIRSEEVAAAATSDAPPANFEFASKVGLEIRTMVYAAAP